MQTRIRNVRILLTTLGLLAVILSFIVIFRDITQLRAWRGDPLFDISIAVMLLGVFLALGGGCLAFRGMKYGSPAA